MLGMVAPYAPILVADDDLKTARRSNAPRPGHVILAVAALVLGIGSCQLPQPPLPKLSVGAVGRVDAVTAARASMDARGGRS